MMTRPDPTLQLKWRDLWIGVAIVLFALALRLVAIADRAQYDAAAFAPLPSGSDQTHYFNSARHYFNGGWPSGAFTFHPGMIYTLIGVQALLGDSLVMARMAMALIGALACGALVAAGWLLTRRAWGGYVAGVLLAVYPVAIFASTDFLTELPLLLYMALWLWLALWQRDRLNDWRSLLIGVVVGLSTIHRMSMIVLAVVWLVHLYLLTRNWRAVLRHSLWFAAGLVLVVGPVAAWNLSHDSPGLITRRHGMREIYVGNSRDANGAWQESVASETIDDSAYAQALISDIQRDPLRFIELQIRKIGMYWSKHEPGNNLNYVINGENASPLLRAIPLDFPILAFFGLLGLVPLYHRDRQTWLVLVAVLFVLFASTVPIMVEGRMRWPIVPPLALSAALVPVMLVRARWWRVLLPALVIVGALVAAEWAYQNLPAKRPYAALPEDVHWLGVTFDNNLELIGWRPVIGQVSVSDRGWGDRGDAYLAEMFWRVESPTDIDYQFSVRNNVNGQGQGGIDGEIGTVSYPPHPTSRWQAGEIYGEIIGFRLPNDTHSAANSEIITGAYILGDEREIIEVERSVDGLIVMQTIAAYDPFAVAPQRDDLTPVDYRFGDLIALKGWRIPEQAETGSEITVRLHWEALRDVPEDYTVFVHLLDADNRVVASHDGPPRSGTLVTSTWKPGYSVHDDIVITLPDQPGTYRMFTGFYSSETLERLPVAGTPDNAIYAGEINVN